MIDQVFTFVILQRMDSFRRSVSGRFAPRGMTVSFTVDAGRDCAMKTWVSGR